MVNKKTGHFMKKKKKKTWGKTNFDDQRAAKRKRQTNEVG